MMGAALAAAAVLGAGLSIFGGISGASAAKKAKRTAKKLTKLNMADFFRLAVDAKYRELETTRQYQWDAQMFKEHREVAISAAMLNPNFGSAAQAAGDTARAVSDNVGIIRRNAQREIDGFLHKRQVTKLQGRAAADQFAAQGLASIIGGFSGALSIGGSYAAASRTPSPSE